MQQDLLANYEPEHLVAKTFGKHPRTLKRWRDHRVGPPFVKIGSSIFYPKDELQKWLRSRIVRPITGE